MSLLQKGLCCGFGIHNHTLSSLKLSSVVPYHAPLKTPNSPFQSLKRMTRGKPWKMLKPLSAALPLTEDNVRLVLNDAREELGQIFDTSVGITGVAELAELDGPFVKISLKGRFWHKRSMVVARLGNYLKHRIPEILEVEIEDVKQLDDSPENF